MAHRYLAASALAGALYGLGPSALAAETRVSTPTELQAAIAAAQPGDVIVLADGVYAIPRLSCAAEGTAAQPITVRAASPLGARVEVSTVEGFKISGAYWTFDGLDVVGVCGSDSDCEHAFHVTGAADGFRLLRSRVRNFNAQLKVNSELVAGAMRAPHRGLVAYSELFDEADRKTSNPVTKLNIDTGDDWVVRGNYLHDFGKDGGNGVSYGAFMKSGGSRGLYEGNLVVCTTRAEPRLTRIGLSFGGGGTAPQFCAPAYDASVPCSVEHRNGTLQNNIIAGCTDAGIYLNRSADTRVLYNTLITDLGVDFRFDTSSGVAHGNLLAGALRDRDGGSHTEGPNLAGVALTTFAQLYRAPALGDLRLQPGAELSRVVGQGTPIQGVSTDYCGRPRSATLPTLGALESQLGDCDTVPPREPSGGAAGAGGGAGAGGEAGTAGTGSDAGAAGRAGSDAGGGSAGTLGTGGGSAGTAPGGDPTTSDGGCGCRVGAARSSGAAALLTLTLLALLRRRRAR